MKKAHPRHGGQQPHQTRRRSASCRRPIRLPPPAGLYDEFCARFPYDETEDQDNAIEATLDDLGRQADGPADLRRRRLRQDRGGAARRLRRRDGGKQVAVVVPTTLLARQHFKTFTQRFAGLPVRIEQLSRMVSAADSARRRPGIAQAPSTSSSAPTRSRQDGPVSRTSASWSSTRSSISASATRNG